MVSAVLNYIATSFCLTFNGVALACLVVLFFRIKNEQGLRLKFLTVTRATYCLLMVCYMCYELHSLKQHRSNGNIDFFVAFALFGCGTTSSWLLVHEYLVGARELKFQLNKNASTRREVRQRKLKYQIVLIVGTVIIWVPIFIEMIWFRDQIE